MKITLLVLIGVLGVVPCTRDTALAASPAYCALYAREYAHQSTPFGAASGTASVEDVAYYRCLNSDQEPPLPRGSAYFGTSIGRYPVDTGESNPSQNSDDDPHRIASTASTILAARPLGRSRLTPGTAEWTDWCSSHYPNSFDPNTGTIVPSDTGKREFC